MAYRKKWKPSKSVAREYAEQMDRISAFCAANGISASASMDSYYFTLHGQKYRVSNHSIEASNAGAVNWCGERTRAAYHPGGREPDTIYIHAGKTRIMEIYDDLRDGKRLDGRGNRIE